MTLKKSFQLALSNLMFDKMRSLLTMLGMIIGVGAVIILISLMNGMMGMMNDEFAKLGTDTVTMTVQDRGGSRTIDENDVYSFVNENSDMFKGVSPTVTIPGALIKSNGDDITTNVTGVNEQYVGIQQLEVEQGRFLSYMDTSKKSRYCVIGTYIERKFFGQGAAIGQTLKINGESFKVIGVLKEDDDSSSGSTDDVMYIPYTTAVTLSPAKFIGSYTLWTTSVDIVDTAIAKTKQYLQNKIGDDDYYNVSSIKQIMDMANTMTGTMQTLLVCIAGISLLVSGIGIMNIMLVSVTERTREIGIRKSLGAKGRDIKSQFVIEAATISGVGGLIGIFAGSVLAVFFGNLLGLKAVPSAGAILLSFGISVGIGIIFGFLPAKNAANLNPIDALRHE